MLTFGDIVGGPCLLYRRGTIRIRGAQLFGLPALLLDLLAYRRQLLLALLGKCLLDGLREVFTDESGKLVALGMHDSVQPEIQLRLVELKELVQKVDETLLAVVRGCYSH